MLSCRFLNSSSSVISWANSLKSRSLSVSVSGQLSLFLSLSLCLSLFLSLSLSLDVSVSLSVICIHTSCSAQYKVYIVRTYAYMHVYIPLLLFFWRTLKIIRSLAVFSQRSLGDPEGQVWKFAPQGSSQGPCSVLIGQLPGCAGGSLFWNMHCSMNMHCPGRHTAGRASRRWTSFPLKLFLVVYHPSPRVLYLSMSRRFQFLAEEIALLINISYGKVFFQTQGKEQDNFPWFRKVRAE